MWPTYIRILCFNLRGNLNFFLLHMYDNKRFFPVHRILRNTKSSKKSTKTIDSTAATKTLSCLLFERRGRLSLRGGVATKVNRYSGAFKDYVHIIFITSCLVREGICRTWFLSRIFVRLFNVRTKVLTSQYEIEVSNRRRELYLFTLFIYTTFWWGMLLQPNPIQSTNKLELCIFFSAWFDRSSRLANHE